ncbi:MAG: CinA domain-containing protein, partial [Halothiobacillaceae bacterium]
DVALAISGVAGPGGGSLDKPVGTVWIAWGEAGRTVRAKKFVFQGAREQVRQQAVTQALRGVVELLDGGA